jgi:hypothetical protein
MIITAEKEAKNVLLLSFSRLNCPKKNNHPRGENSSNLVTLPQTNFSD